MNLKTAVKPKHEEIRIIDATTSARRERFIVACILDQPDVHPGPNICTAIAYSPYWWDSPEAGQLAAAIAKCWRAQRPTTEPTVAEYLGYEWRKWLSHPSFAHNNALNLEIAELEAIDLVQRYFGKRIVAMLGEAYHRAQEHPEKARGVVAQLKLVLGEFI